MSRQFWNETLFWAVADGTAVANTASETVIYPDVTIPANFLQDGRVLRLAVAGKYSSTANPTIQFTTRWGGVAGTLLCQSATILCSGVTNYHFLMESTITTRVNGSAGTLMPIGCVYVQNSSWSPYLAFPMGAAAGTAPTAVTSLNLASDTALSVTAKWSAASPSNTLTGMSYFIEALN